MNSRDKKISIEQDDLNIVLDILKQAPVKFFVYGSRARGTSRRFSDLDLCYKKPLSQELLYKLIDDFQESDLPFKVDFTDYGKCDENFRRIIDKDLIEIKS